MADRALYAPETIPGRTIHLPAGTEPAGQRVRGVCTCGYRTTPRVSKERALEAVRESHGENLAGCQLCRRGSFDFSDGPTTRAQALQYFEVVSDPQTGNEVLACRNDKQACQQLAAEHVDNGIAPNLQLVRDDTNTR